MSQSIDGARLTLLLNDLRLPAIKQGWATFAERADKEGWPAARFLAALAEHEKIGRGRTRAEPLPAQLGSLEHARPFPCPFQTERFLARTRDDFGDVD